MKLQGRIAAITGGTRGIGRGIAEAFLAEGAAVVINGRSEAKGAATLAELDAGERVTFVTGDVQRQADAERVVAATIERYGRIDILVNNAGGSSGFGPISAMTDEAWNQALNWNLNSTFWATRAALRDMIPRGWGRIINISSVESRTVNKPNVGHYVTCKHAINGLTKAVAFENGQYGITCNAILPGAVETDIMREGGAAAARSMGLTYEAFLGGYAQEAAIGRINTVAEVAAVALLLASELGGGISGAMLDVNGGTAL